MVNGSKGYAEYINSQMWRDLRQQALERDHYACRMCSNDNTTSRLEVHHRKYPDAWENDCLDNLTTVCIQCHDIYTDAQRRTKYKKKGKVHLAVVNEAPQVVLSDEKERSFCVMAHESPYPSR